MSFSRLRHIFGAFQGSGSLFDIFKALANFMGFSRLRHIFGAFQGSGSLFDIFRVQAKFAKLFMAQSHFLSLSRLGLNF